MLVFAAGTADSGISVEWEATEYQPGLFALDELSRNTVEVIAARIASERRPGDIVVVSLHWGGNWGYEVAPEHQRFAHQLIDLFGTMLQLTPDGKLALKWAEPVKAIA